MSAVYGHWTLAVTSPLEVFNLIFFITTNSRSCIVKKNGLIKCLWFSLVKIKMGLENLVYGLQNLLYLFPFTWYGIFHSNIHDRIYMLEVEELQEG